MRLYQEQLFSSSDYNFVLQRQQPKARSPASPAAGSRAIGRAARRTTPPCSRFGSACRHRRGGQRRGSPRRCDDAPRRYTVEDRAEIPPWQSSSGYLFFTRDGMTRRNFTLQVRSISVPAVKPAGHRAFQSYTSEIGFSKLVAIIQRVR